MKQYKIRSTKAVVTFYKAFAKQTTQVVYLLTITARNHNSIPGPHIWTDSNLHLESKFSVKKKVGNYFIQYCKQRERISSTYCTTDTLFYSGSSVEYFPQRIEIIKHHFRCRLRFLGWGNIYLKTSWNPMKCL